MPHHTVDLLTHAEASETSKVVGPGNETGPAGRGTLLSEPRSTDQKKPSPGTPRGPRGDTRPALRCGEPAFAKASPSPLQRGPRLPRPRNGVRAAARRPATPRWWAGATGRCEPGCALGRSTLGDCRGRGGADLTWLSRGSNAAGIRRAPRAVRRTDGQRAFPDPDAAEVAEVPVVAVVVANLASVAG